MVSSGLNVMMVIFYVAIACSVCVFSMDLVVTIGTLVVTRTVMIRCMRIMSTKFK